MKIALVAPPFIPVPPAGYGGTELFIASLAETLVKRGHQVVVYANGESHGSFEVRALYPTGEWPPPSGVAGQFRSLTHYAWAIRDAASSCDVIHVNDVSGVFFSPFVPQRMLLTLHHPNEELLSSQYAHYPDVTYVAISDAQRSGERMPRLVTVHHGIECGDYRVRQDKDEFVAFLGRIAPCKGLDVAIEIARRSGVPLKIAGQIQSFFQDYWERDVKPHIDGRFIEYIGEADLALKNELLGRARALLFPIQWEEPFGLVMLEAMACGTPVVAFDRGSVREVIVDGSTGWIRHGIDEMVDVVRDQPATVAAVCRRHVEQYFSVQRMAASYERVYRSLLSGQPEEDASSAMATSVGPGREPDLSLPGAPQIHHLETPSA